VLAASVIVFGASAMRSRIVSWASPARQVQGPAMESGPISTVKPEADSHSGINVGVLVTPDEPTNPATSSTPTPNQPTLALSPSASPTHGVSAIPSVTPTATPDVARQIEQAVIRFQEAKAYSQRTGDTSQLSQVLTGSALDRQISLVEQWHAQGCYWEISLDAPMEVRILELRSGNWTRVEVEKVETRLLYCKGTLDSATRGDAYTTVYVVELAAGQWRISERE
jgi:hypothetical protein